MPFVAPAPTLAELFDSIEPNDAFHVIGMLAKSPPAAEYLHWDKLRHLDPPDGLSREDWWQSLKLGRIEIHLALQLL